MTIAIGDSIPDTNLMVMGANGPEGVSTAELFGGKKVLMFAVPGAFTPGCSMTHLPDTSPMRTRSRLRALTPSSAFR